MKLNTRYINYTNVTSSKKDAPRWHSANMKCKAKSWTTNLSLTCDLVTCDFVFCPEMTLVVDWVLRIKQPTSTYRLPKKRLSSTVKKARTIVFQGRLCKPLPLCRLFLRCCHVIPSRRELQRRKGDGSCFRLWQIKYAALSASWDGDLPAALRRRHANWPITMLLTTFQRVKKKKKNAVESAYRERIN